jgi:Fur family transcriptional regulator, ferric uptake regulator
MLKGWKDQSMTGLEPDLQRLRDAGFKITDARRIVLEVLHRSSGHLTSSEIIEQVEAEDSSIGRASIFRTLELLTSQAIVRPTFLNPTTPSYVLMSQEGHHSHIICTQCDRVIELDECHVDKMMAELQERHGIRLTGHLVEFYGICDDCIEQH